ncbi:esterase-like activity of phytase family protein [Escherichia coli]
MAVESSLKQDGAYCKSSNKFRHSTLTANSRDADGRPSKQLHEYLYITDPVPQVSKFGINDNGVSEVLALNDHQLLVINVPAERQCWVQ